MKFLIISDFKEEANSGAAGTLISVGKSLLALGHDVDYLWQLDKPYKSSKASLQILFELPKRQYEQVSAQLKVKDYDVVMISQPFAYLVYEKLMQQYPKTLFLNRTHGWEHRVNDACQSYEWDGMPKQIPLRVWRRLRGHILSRFCERTAKACHGLIAPSSRCAQFIRNSYEIPESKIATIPYGLGENYLGHELPQKSEGGEIKMLYVGNYIPMKGSLVMESLLPNLAKTYSNAQMTFVVPEEDAPNVREYYSESFGNRLNVLSWMNREDLRTIYASHDILLFPSLFEGFGKTLLEAMAFGLCVVGYGEGGLVDIAKSGESALYCEVGDKKRLHEMLSQCLKNVQVPRKMGWLAHQLVQSHTWERHAQETIDFCHHLRKTNSAAV